MGKPPPDKKASQPPEPHTYVPPAKGAAAYKKAMGKEPEDESAARPALPPDDPPVSRHAKRAMPENILLKTGLENQGKPKKDPARFIKKTNVPLTGKEASEPSSKSRRAAQFMMLIGSDEAAKILSKLDRAQVEAISKEIVTIKSIHPDEAEAVLEEFRALLSPAYGYSGSSYGGVDEARKLLYAAFGPEKGEEVLKNAVPSVKENPFDFLADFNGEQIAMLFRDESPAACAMVFSRLPPKISAQALANTTPERKMEIVRRIARLKESSPEVIERVAAAIKEKARLFGRNSVPEGELDGKGVLAAILRHSDVAFGGQLLEDLEESDPDLSREMKDRLYTLEDVANAADRPIQEKLRSMSDYDIALLLRGRSDAFTQKIMWNLSSQRKIRIKEENEIMGPVPKIEAEAAAREFLTWFRDARAEGRILMLKDEDVVI
ncbi:MAG: flagellar motor switch protein FliG [Treponema sp.]|jgi:flagellar motor switch protein FliG|nr:flagellar motor switch protein FliG [Treponema sp.]